MLPSILTLTTAFATQAVGGQLPELVHFDSAPGDSGGCEVAAGGDFDADGVPDFALRFLNRVEARSGRTHTVLWSAPVPTASSYGSMALVHDVNQDGRDELVVGSRALHRVTLLSGADGAVLWERTEPTLHSFGAGVDAGGDMSGDGVADIVVHAPDANDPFSYTVGACVVLSGADGGIVHQFYLGARAISGVSGRQVAAIGDVDLDGKEDFIVGAVLQYGVPTSTRVYSGATGALIRSLSVIPSISFGSTVASAGDLNDDGIPDHLVADTLLSTIYGFSGADGVELWRTRIVPDSAFLGLALCGGADCDGDGIPDVLAGAPQATQVDPRFYGSVSAFSGATGEMLWRLNGSRTTRIGRSTAFLGDTNGNGHPEVLIDGSLANYRSSTLVWMFARLVEWFPGLRADSDQLSVRTGGRIEFQSRWPLEQAGSPYVLLASARGPGPTNIGGIHVPLTPDAWTSRILHHSASALTGAIGRLDASASAAPVLELHPGAATHLLGSTFWFSLVVGTHRQPVAASVAKTITFLP